MKSIEKQTRATKAEGSSRRLNENFVSHWLLTLARHYQIKISPRKLLLLSQHPFYSVADIKTTLLRFKVFKDLGFGGTQRI